MSLISKYRTSQSRVITFCFITVCVRKVITFCVKTLVHFALKTLLHFALVLHVTAILSTFCVSFTLCGDYYILRRNTGHKITFLHTFVGASDFFQAVVL